MHFNFFALWVEKLQNVQTNFYQCIAINWNITANKTKYQFIPNYRQNIHWRLSKM